MHYDIATDEYRHYHVAIPEVADEIIRKECTIPQDNPFATKASTKPSTPYQP